MSFFVENTTYKVPITDPESGEKAEVELRRFDAGARAVLEDTVRLTAGEDATAEVLLGTMRLITVEQAIVTWTLPVSPTKDSIRKLQPKVFDQIYAAIDVGGVEEESPLATAVAS
jgi:hypothetical protein